MKTSAPLGILLSILAVSVIFIMPPSVNIPNAHAPALPRLEVWNPDLRSSNITSLTLFPQGKQFTVMVNITGAGPITGFDITLNYNITNSPSVIYAVKTGTELSGGLFDPYQFPAGSGCSILSPHQDIFPGRPIRFDAVVQGDCPVQGSGILFTINFVVSGVGATSLDIVQTSTSGKLLSTIIGPSPNFPNIQYQLFDAYFRNAPGIPPVPQFTYKPPTPLVGENVQFNATQSFDPDNSTMAGKGIKQYIWDFGDGTRNDRGSVVSHIFISSATVPASGTFSVKLVVVDVDDNLPQRQIILVTISPGVVHDISVSISLNKPEVNVGDPVAVTVTVSNRGNRDEVANLSVTYDFQGSTTLARESGIVLPRTGLSSKIFNYTLQTGSLPPRTYTIGGLGTIVNATTGAVVPDSNPLDNLATVSFTLLGANVGASISVPVLAGSVIAVLVAAWAVIYVLRRRRKEKDTDFAR